MERLAPILRKMREEQQISQEELAESIGCSRQTIFAIERGISDPSLTLARKIADFFDRQVEEVFFGEEIDRFFEEALQTLPAVNVKQDDENIYVEVALPAEVKSQSVEAVLKDGTLSITLPKAEPTKPKTTKVKIKTA